MDQPVTGERFCLYDGPELDAVLAGMARQIAARYADRRSVVLVGILRRGLPLAQRLQVHLKALGVPDWPCYPLQLKRYSDDLRLLHPETALTENPEIAALDLANTTLLLVDDVLYQGHSLLRACAWLASIGAREIRPVVLVDRQVHRQPVQADVVGLSLQVASGDVIECHVPPYEAQWGIELLRPAR
ncbi:phosphoribosyltransferase family protein [Pseudomonas sp. NW5]|uniref:phosphoribosyltransferase family protein n=1 Tax=Pseudomonas sp. NW5 TaxID=2934934 RepID=UPI0020213B47|nr:phosphoribosyltransferase family protein [Pseudomonas sp. NW5]MCL7461678.1 phosphoribosyltransferase [Pseudomonas sp. NW5]